MSQFGISKEISKIIKHLAVSTFLIIAFCKPAHCEIFMYQDDAGKWHGVSTKDQIPEQYRNQTEAVGSEAQAPPQMSDDMARQILGLDPTQPRKTEEQLKAELLKTIEENMAYLVGSQIAPNWQMTDYKVVAVNISNANTPWPTALITLKITASNSEEGDRNFIRKFSGRYDHLYGGRWNISDLGEIGP